MNKKRIMSFLLSVLMLMSLVFPAGAFAENGDAVEQISNEEVYLEASQQEDQNMTPEEVDETVPEEVDETVPEEVDETVPEEVDETVPEEVDETVPEEVDEVVEVLKQFYASKNKDL